MGQSIGAHYWFGYIFTDDELPESLRCIQEADIWSSLEGDNAGSDELGLRSEFATAFRSGWVDEPELFGVSLIGFGYDASDWTPISNISANQPSANAIDELYDWAKAKGVDQKPSWHLMMYSA